MCTSLALWPLVQVATRGRLGFVLGCAAVAVGAACSSSGSDSSPSVDDAGADAPAPTPPTPEAGTTDSSTTHPVTFSYRPSWKGVKSVAVIGAFGTSTDWKQPFITLTDDGTGTFTGTAPALASGHYLYLFQAAGDEAAAAAKADAFPHFAIDPSSSAFAACPVDAPTYSKQNANPCSDLAVPQAAPAAMFHARGVVQSAGAPIGGYLVVIERDETASHHMFANRTTAGADGTFDLVVAAGTYRFQVLHPTFYAMTDAQRSSPETLGAVRRAISSGTMISADRTINAAEVSYGGYAAMTPRNATTLPTTFTFTVPAGTKARAAVYGTGVEIGDPWWAAPFGTVVSDDFDGGFNTKQAPDGGPKPDASYFWGAEQQYAMPDGGVTWTAQSMVFPVQWP